MDNHGSWHTRCCLAIKLIMIALASIALASAALAQQARDESLVVSVQNNNEAPSNAPLTITLQDALQRAKANNPQFQSAVTDLGLAQQDRVQSRAGMLPSVTYTTQFLYTQGNGTSSGKFIANNGVHEYLAQGDVHQVFSPAVIAEYRRTGAAVALAKAKAEIAARGLVVTVVQAYYAYVVAQRKYATVQQAAVEAQRFLDVSRKLEKGGEVAHSDVVKAQIQYQQQQRDLQEAQLQMNKSRLELAILLFPDFNENFSLVDDLGPPAPVPSFEEVQAAGAKNNPQLRAAVAALREAGQAVGVAWSGMLPSVSLDYFYGIDASHFAVRQFDPLARRVVDNLGYAGTATLSLPIWNWGAGYSRVRQASLKRRQARVELSFAQRLLLADLRSFYNELQAARSELELLSQSAQLAAESLRLTTLRYQAGEATVLEVVDAQNTLKQARNAYDDGQVRFRVAQANLQTLTGTL